MSRKLLAGALLPALLLGTATPANAGETSTAGSSLGQLSSAITPRHPSGMPAEAIVRFGVVTREELDRCREENAGDPDVPVGTSAIDWMEAPCPATPITPDELADARTAAGIHSVVTAPLRLVLGFLNLVFSLFNGAGSSE
ncbi:hypothetical protein [Corynebacterium pygosceleis]|uniref:Secreted protein n=1 Tax=Corynebacterium pygosceleis TaxID=2800406 RepID=A0ABT3WTW2_9CORY|nr:hypothetical protein [Corynebacterium pygosceleis]MCL0121322.1 hypothetical protein [Corynebacterium pygosceleis]MCX7445665.1 hypothetical protein [Corynebacterium pygosceleis]